MLALRLKPELENRLANLAKKTGRTKTFYAIKAIEQQLDDMEDYYLAEQPYNDWIVEGKKHILLMRFLTDVYRRILSKD
ncbi:type II toxin-antitoxin system RelB family antitoxin [Treponema vincentii]|uniref:type II toxin-antitoxin system RelB family antitoxin n=1 Tax=Treponema vincentii TaxID=69710 RepID=UPI0020A246DC|nr:TraY domain-containing protein [Treponema vincentii]UTC47492.1 TraY domain-containing protein [Treponema vincentii]